MSKNAGSGSVLNESGSTTLPAITIKLRNWYQIQNCITVGPTVQCCGSEIRDPVLFYPLDPGVGMNFFWIPDPRGMFFGEIFLRIVL
jgi:hypothetical protein